MQAPTPEFVPVARGNIFNSALDIMATHQSVYSDDMAHTLGSDINSLVGTLPTNVHPQVSSASFLRGKNLDSRGVLGIVGGRFSHISGQPHHCA